MATEAIAKENGKKEVGVDEVVSGMDISDSKDAEGGKGVTPNGRPVRERKVVDRYSLSSPQSFTPKALSIPKGSGTPLKDIPNVAFKLSKRKPDETLQQLHLILFKKRAKAHDLKKDIGLFSGFAWEENEEKERAKMKERLDKLVKEKLVDICDVLNIPIKSTDKKEVFSVKLLEFLELPHATTEVLLADKEELKRKKKKRLAKSSRSKTKKKTQSGQKRKRTSTGEESESDDMDDKMSDQSHSSGEEDDVLLKQDSDQEQTSLDEEKDEVEDKETSPKKSSKDNSKKSAKGLVTSAKKSKDISDDSKSSKKTKDTPNDSKSSKKTKDAPKRQKVDEKTKSKKSISMDKSPSKKANKSTKLVGGEEETNEEDKVEPTKEELHDAAVNILKEVDFNTATISDILRLIGSHFGLDLMHRKGEVKAVIQQVLESMSGGDADEGEDDDNEEEDDGADESSAEE